MSTIASLSEGQIEALAKVLGDCGTGSDISRVLQACGLEDKSGESTKWRRLYWVFMDSQRRYGCANHVLNFIQTFVTPARFVRRSEEFEEHRQKVNFILTFSGLEYGTDGKFRERTAAQTLEEAERRVRTIRAKFQGRQIHPEVLKYCQVELMQDNYYHAGL